MREQQSVDIGKLAEALAKAQGDIQGAVKDSTNPHFRSKYADLASVWDACREQLSKNGLSVIQTMDDEERPGDLVTVVTTLAHSSGQWIRGRLAMKPVKSDPQGIGSAITYARRYALAAMVGVAPEDDDGNAASARSAPDVQMEQPNKKSPIGPWKGPLTKTDLQKAIRALVHDMNGCTDPDELNGMIRDNQAIIDQCEADTPDWFSGEPHDAFVPLQMIISQRIADLNPTQAG